MSSSPAARDRHVPPTVSLVTASPSTPGRPQHASARDGTETSPGRRRRCGDYGQIDHGHAPEADAGRARSPAAAPASDAIPFQRRPRGASRRADAPPPAPASARVTDFQHRRAYPHPSPRHAPGSGDRAHSERQRRWQSPGCDGRAAPRSAPLFLIDGGTMMARMHGRRRRPRLSVDGRGRRRRARDRGHRRHDGGCRRPTMRGTAPRPARRGRRRRLGDTATPIKHVIVIIGENHTLRQRLRDLPAARPASTC